MPGKTVSLSVRISQDDSDFLAGLAVGGAVTPSDKIRALIAEARQKRASLENYRDGLAFMQGLLGPEMRYLREVENAHNVHSELMAQVFTWLPEVTAYLINGIDQNGEDHPDLAQLKEIEGGLADRVVLLFENLLRLALTTRNPCYSENAISSRLEPIIELSTLIQSTTQRRGTKS